MTHYIDGKAYARTLQNRIAETVKHLPTQPTLAVILVGDDPASQVYVRNKIKFTQACGMLSLEHRLDADSTEQAIISTIETLNADANVDGILLQLPLPDGLNSDRLIAKIESAKDVDGLTEISAGRLLSGKPGLRPCTPTGCVILAQHTLGNLSGKHCVILGRSILVGKPAALLFLEQDCTVTIAHSRTQNLAEICRSADILVTAVGRPEMVKGGWIKPNACVIDVGINRIAHPNKPGRTYLVGDVDSSEADGIAAHLTPVPGGVGPMTIACLLQNTILAACYRRGWPIPTFTQDANP